MFDSCMHSFFALTDVGQVAHPTACLGALVEPVCRGDRPGLPLTIGSPRLPLYLYIYMAIQTPIIAMCICGSALCEALMVHGRGPDGSQSVM
jgi:hypothetical protein